MHEQLVQLNARRLGELLENPQVAGISLRMLLKGVSDAPDSMLISDGVA